MGYVCSVFIEFFFGITVGNVLLKHSFKWPVSLKLGSGWKEGKKKEERRAG